MSRWVRIAGGIDRMNDGIGRVSAWLCFVMIVVGASNAVLRYVGRYVGKNLGSNAYLELQWYLFSALFLLGAAYTLRHNGHVRVDVLYGALSRRKQAWINLLGTLLFLLPFTGLMIGLSWHWMLNSWHQLEVSPDPGGLPRYPIKTLIPLAFALLFLQGVSEAIKHIVTLRGGAIETDDDEATAYREGV